MTQLTIRSQSKELEAKLRELAKERGWSLNQAANYLLCKGANLLENQSSSGMGNLLDEFIGSWSEAEAQDFDARITDAFEVVEKDLWK